MLTGEKYADSFKGGKFDRISPKNEFNPDFSSLGAWELGMRYSEFDASEIKSVVNGGIANTIIMPANSGSTVLTNKADAYTIGLKFIPQANARFLVNYVNTDFDTPVTLFTKTMTKEKALMFRAQYDF